MPKGNPAGYLPNQKKKAAPNGLRGGSPKPPARYRPGGMK